MLNIGLLGTGFMGTIQADAFANQAGVRLAVVADVNRAAADKLAGQYGARAAYTIEAVLDDPDIAVVSICLPTFLHADTVVAAAARAKHILCEKPLALSLAAVDQMQAAVQRAGVKCMVAQVIRFWPEYVRIREALESGQLGRPRLATGARLASPPGYAAWLSDPALSGGALFDFHVHDLDFVFSLFGKPQKVYAAGMRGATGGWDHVVTSLDYGDKKAVIEAGWAQPPGFPFHTSFRLTGETGCVDFRSERGEQRAAAQNNLVLYRAGAAPEFLVPPAEDGVRAEVRYFVECLQAGRDPAVATLAEAREVIAIILAAKQSLETGTVVSL